jgi:ubiquinone/menaquinone biosynthesis C-methylase UbiE
MIAVIGEIPEPEKAIKEFYRVLPPSGTLAFSELLLDPDYPRAKTLICKTAAARFRLKNKVGNAFHYTLIFGKDG